MLGLEFYCFTRMHITSKSRSKANGSSLLKRIVGVENVIVDLFGFLMKS